ncbi:hypothetical protein Pyn_31945 [Prunus yedoensis var. nudiflora]|uniref:Uncharacterized protein n=1 Tax=Prunus yedoensis var. nudiflora TaxID=2094558 RepID=A0A314UDW5_PRUYE|nr:hypothetical protein Pyn_31945 [Prunus yedoensis var. nudiflora]
METNATFLIVVQVDVTSQSQSLSFSWSCIPVLFDPFTAYYQYPWHLPEDHEKYSVFVDQEEVRQVKVNVVEMLMKISKKERDDMRRYIVYELLPGLVYGDSTAKLEKFQDAFSIIMSNLMERVTKMDSTA